MSDKFAYDEDTGIYTQDESGTYSRSDVFIAGELSWESMVPEGHTLEDYEGFDLDTMAEGRAMIEYGIDTGLVEREFDPDIYAEGGQGQPSDSAHPRNSGHGRRLTDEGYDIPEPSTELGQEGDQIIIHPRGEMMMAEAVGGEDRELDYFEGTPMEEAQLEAGGDLGQYSTYVEHARLMIDAEGNVIFSDDSREAMDMIAIAERDRTEGHIGREGKMEHRQVIGMATREVDILRKYYGDYDCDINIWYGQRSQTLFARNELHEIYQYDYHTFLDQGKMSPDHLPFLFGDKERDYFTIPKHNWIGAGKKANKMPVNQVDAISCLHKLELWNVEKHVGNQHHPTDVNVDHEREVDLRFLLSLIHI